LIEERNTNCRKLGIFGGLYFGSEKKVNMPKEDKIKALDVITKYFYAFSQNDFDKMRSLSTDVTMKNICMTEMYGA